MSTAHAIYIVRRIQDFAESTSSTLSLALLDWEKAFDKVQHDKLILSLSRLGFPDHYLDVIQDCYRKPEFYVKDEYGTSQTKVQSSGIRQGCPLSPFLFVMVMTCVDTDIREAVSCHVINNRIPGLDYDMVYYADDTILFSLSNRGLNELLSLTEKISQQYGLHLNRGKCVAIPMNNDGRIHFADGSALTKCSEATYLGNELNQEVNIQHEILNKIQEVHRAWFKLSSYWKATCASKKWKLIVFDAIIRSKLLYGLETVHLTQAMYKRIDAFQYRSLRRILGMPSTFINRANTNKKLLEAATAAAFPTRGDRRKIASFSNYHQERRAKLLGHVLRSGNEDPTRQISFLPGTACRIDYGKRRCGRPRQNWLHFAKKFVYEQRLSNFNYTGSTIEDEVMYEAAHRRDF